MQYAADGLLIILVLIILIILCCKRRRANYNSFGNSTETDPLHANIIRNPVFSRTGSQATLVRRASAAESVQNPTPSCASGMDIPLTPLNKSGAASPDEFEKFLNQRREEETSFIETLENMTGVPKDILQEDPNQAIFAQSRKKPDDPRFTV